MAKTSESKSKSTAKSKTSKSSKELLRGSALLLQRDDNKVEHFPMLDVVFDKFVHNMSLDLRNFFQTNTESKLKDVYSLSFDEYVQKLSGSEVFNVIKTKNWESSNIVVVEKNLIYALINVLLGGKRQSEDPTAKKEGRTFSTLEFNLIERFVGLVLRELEKAFAVVYPINFALDRQETNPKLIGTISNAVPVIICQVVIEVAEFSGTLEVVLPHTSLDPIRDELLKKHVGDSFGNQSVWRSYLTQELMQADFDLSAVLMEEKRLLSEVLTWKPGVSLNIEPHQLDEVKLRCEDVCLAEGKLGHHNGMVAIEIENVNLQAKPRNSSSSSAV